MGFDRLEPKNVLAGAAYTRSVQIDGLGRARKERNEALEIRSPNNARAPRGRKGKEAAFSFKPAEISRVD